MIEARQQSTTSYPILLYMVLSSDHVTAATGKTLTVTLSKNGGSFASASGSVTELANGWYYLAGNATDRNTLGTLAIRATASSCDDAAKIVEIVPYDPFARIDANTTYLAGSVISTSSAQIGVNVVNFGGAAGHFSSGRPEVNTTLIEGVDATNQLASAAGGAGTGARTITITVDDGSDEIEGAIVRLTNGVQTYTDTTNSSGIATLNVDDATWTVAITKLGYSFAGTSLVVNGDETQAYSMTAVVISPAAPGQTTGYLTTRDGGGTAKGGVTVAFKLIEGPGTDGNSYDAGEFEATSDGAGLLEVTLVQSAKYIATRGDIEVEFTTGTDSTYELPEQLGIDAD